MIDLLLTVIVLAIVFGLAYWLVMKLPLPDPFGPIVQVAVILICLLVLLGVVFGGVDIPRIRSWR